MTSMYRAILALCVALSTALVPGILSAQSITVSGNPGRLTVSTGTPGFGLDPVSDASTTYSATTTQANQRILARLDAPLPAGVSLSAQFTAPSGAASRGTVLLTTTDQEVVGIIPSPGTYSDLSIVYTLSASVSAGPVATTMRSVILTVVGP